MKRTVWLQETRRMRLEEAYSGFQSGITGQALSLMERPSSSRAARSIAMMSVRSSGAVLRRLSSSYNNRSISSARCVAPAMRSDPGMLSDIRRSSSTASIGALTCLTSSQDLSASRSERRRCRKGCSSYTQPEW